MTTIGAYVRFAGIACRCGLWLCLVCGACVLVSAIAPLLAAAAIGRVVALTPAIVADGLGSPAGRPALASVVAAAGLFAVQLGGGGLLSAASAALAERVDFRLQRQLMRSVFAPTGIAHLEDPHTVNLIAVGRDTFRAWLRPGRLATSLSALAQARIVLVGSCVIVASFRWWIGLLLLASGLWTEYEVKAASAREAEHHYGNTELARRTEYVYGLGVTPEAAKEVRIFGLAPFLLDRFVSTWKRSMSHVFAKGSPRGLVSTVLLAVSSLATLGWIGADAFAGSIGVGKTATLLQAIVLTLGAVASGANVRLSSQMSVASLERYEAAIRAIPPATAIRGARVTDAPSREIRFENVGFRYPSTDRDVLRGLDLVVPAARSLAIVGANGAGKTTLVKLLCGLYEPSDGRILVDGVDLADADPCAWRRRVAAVFQDYVHYDMSARTNVGFGRVDAQDDMNGIEAAAQASGVLDTITRLKSGWDTVLSTDYVDGVELSGGEWQKVALARALFAVRHGASVLILDEPAANLDARAEAQLYERFLQLTHGLTTIVISHRFSTVRQASSIAVLSDGRVTELGTHDQLLSLDGRYAEMFRLQASRFEMDEPVVQP